MSKKNRKAKAALAEVLPPVADLLRLIEKSAMTMYFRVAMNEHGRWEVQYSYIRSGSCHEWAFEPGSPDFATKGEATAHMEHERRQDTQANAAECRYASQIAWACGERD